MQQPFLFPLARQRRQGQTDALAAKRRRQRFQFLNQRRGMIAGNVDHDFRDLCRKISGRIPMIMMTGVYDFACTPEMTQQTADKIRNAECIIMKGIGHFPMCENPDGFKKYLMPVLDRLAEYARDRRPGASAERRLTRDEPQVRVSSRRW